MALIITSTLLLLLITVALHYSGDLAFAADDVAVVQFDDWMSTIVKTSSPLSVQPKQFNEPTIVDKLLPAGSPPAKPPSSLPGRQTLENSGRQTPTAAPSPFQYSPESAPIYFDYSTAPAPDPAVTYPSPPAPPLASPSPSEYSGPVYFEWTPATAPESYSSAPVPDFSSTPPSIAAYPSTPPPATPPPPPAYLSGAITVSQDGTGDFESVQDAVNSIPMSNSQRVVIKIKPGVYVEKVTVNQHWITFKGYGSRLTEIQWNDTAASTGTTFNSATVTVNGDHFTARDISFRNTAPAPVSGQAGQQAVALRISGDFAAFIRADFYGYQDTLYDHRGRHYFYRCYIEGSVDFIFGNGRSFYRQCRLNSLADPHGALTAQKRANVTEDTGFAFLRCTVTGSGSVYLGRAWGPASRVVYSYTYFSDIILPSGWNDWGNPDAQETIFYGEYKCYGPGSQRSGRVPWSQLLTNKQAKPFLHTGFINGELWLTEI